MFIMFVMFTAPLHQTLLQTCIQPRDTLQGTILHGEPLAFRKPVQYCNYNCIWKGLESWWVWWLAAMSHPMQSIPSPQHYCIPRSVLRVNGKLVWQPAHTIPGDQTNISTQVHPAPLLMEAVIKPNSYSNVMVFLSWTRLITDCRYRQMGAGPHCKYMCVIILSMQRPRRCMTDTFYSCARSIFSYE